MVTNKWRLKKIIKSIQNGSLALQEGIKKWYTYEFTIQKLIWERNLQDGWLIHVYHDDSNIGTIDIDYNLNKIKYETF